MTSALFPRRIETERLRLEPWTLETVDHRELYRICSSDDGIEDVAKWSGWEPHETPKTTYDLLERGSEQWREGDRPAYVVRLREGERDGEREDGAGEIAGFTSLDVFWEREAAELGIWLRKPLWGRGYSGERAAALLELAFDAFDLELVSVNHDVENDNSRRAIEKYVDRFGGQYDCLVRNHYRQGETLVDSDCYSISKEQWREAVGDERVADFDWDERN